MHAERLYSHTLRETCNVCPATKHGEIVAANYDTDDVVPAVSA